MIDESLFKTEEDRARWKRVCRLQDEADRIKANYVKHCIQDGVEPYSKAAAERFPRNRREMLEARDQAWINGVKWK